MFLFNTFESLLVVIFSIVLVSEASTTDYCKSNLCPINYPHIGCKNDGKFGPKCSKDTRVVEMTADIIDFILKKHNDARKAICDGNLGKFGPANRMIELV